MSDRWDYYEVTFSVDGDEDEALTIYEQIAAIDGVKGPCFSSGMYAPHPHSKADVDKATEAVLAEFLRVDGATDLEDERQGNESPERFVARRAVEVALAAIYTEAPS